MEFALKRDFEPRLLKLTHSPGYQSTVNAIRFWERRGGASPMGLQAPLAP